MANVKIVYGSGGGNTELVCEKVAEVLEMRGHRVELLKAKLTEPEQVGEYDLLIFASPTYGHGQLEQYFEKFLSKMESVDLTGKPCSIIGLGDPKYDNDYHIESAKVIMDFLKRKNAKMVYIPLRVSKCPLPLLNGHVGRWAEKLSEELSKMV